MKFRHVLRQAVVVVLIDSFVFSQVMPLYAAPAPGGGALPSPTENRHASIRVSPDSASVLRLGDMSLEIPPGAVSSPMEIGVQELPLTITPL